MGAHREPRRRLHALQQELVRVKEKLAKTQEALALALAEAEAIEHASRRFQETGIIGVLYWRTDGKVTYVNDACLNMLGYTREEFERDGLDWRCITPPEYAHTDVQAFIEMNARGYCTPYEKAYWAKNGEVVPIQIGSAYWEGTNEGGVCWILDIRERKRAEMERTRLLEAEQLARREAEAANAAKDQFLAVVSHELRTPLTAILGWAQLLRAGPGNGAMRERALETIERNARLQARLIDDILDVSRIIAGKLALDMHEVVVADVVHAAADSLRLASREKKIELSVEVEPGLPVICADASRLQQVIWNLVQNALKFTPSGGRVRVRAFRLASGEVSVEVSDTGQGIAPQFLPHVFERFRQADGSATRVHRGLGLGLAIVRQLVALHGGSVHAASDGVGRGATLSIILPVGAPAPASRSSWRRIAVAQEARLDGVHVLVVDDEPDIREWVASTLGEKGARTSTASSVAEALEVVRSDTPRVVLSDIAMPHVDGFDLVRAIKELDPAIVCCALTALASPQDRERVLSAGFDVHLSKPASPAQIVETVLSLIRPDSPQPSSPPSALADAP